ncbi:MAG: non-ribosomal peptide synthetase, partial [Gammaproteobacteria bacterium]|nr:non-ribosomal peptide synthetase [Gammaproteobacteria bacterium]
LAQHLISIGVEPGQLVGILLDRSDRTVVALLAVLKAGCAYLPLDPAYPPERLRFMLEDSQAPVLITEDSVLGKELEQVAAQTLYLDLDAEMIARASEHAPAIEMSATDPMYVIYTSGSTGTPKGVIGSHRSMVNRFEWMWSSYPFEDGDVCCQKTSLSFVDSVWEIFGPLLKGITTVLIPNEVQKDVTGLVDTLEEHRISRIVLVPSMLQAILDSGTDLDARLPSLRLWVTSGEYLSRELAQRFVNAAPKATLLNLYGSSEVAADSTYYDTRGHDFDHPIPIGRPIANTQAYVLDGNGELCPMGVPGELYIGGEGLAIGYLKREALTVECFVTDPFSGIEGSRIYRTGDRVRWQADGQLQYLQRLDGQVNLRGYRIELGEIESVLGTHESVNSAVVVAHEMGAGDTRLVAYWVSNESSIVTGTQLRTFLRERLPAYMIPQHFIDLHSFPLTPNGKVDRKVLPNIFQLQEIDSYVAPQTPIEQRIASIWQEVLKTDRVGINDNFFDLGGHSLLAVQLVARIKKEVGVEVTLRSLVSDTLSQVAHNLEKELDDVSFSKSKRIGLATTMSRMLDKFRFW